MALFKNYNDYNDDFDTPDEISLKYKTPGSDGGNSYGNETDLSDTITPINHGDNSDDISMKEGDERKFETPMVRYDGKEVRVMATRVEIFPGVYWFPIDGI